MESSERNWRQLAAEVTRRRRELGLTQEDVRGRGGPSTATMRLIEGALQESYRPGILASLERALSWAPGSVESILAGGEPKTVIATHLVAADRYLTKASGYSRASINPPQVPGDDADIQLVLDSDLPQAEKDEIIRGLLEERLDERRRRVAQAQRYIDLYRRTAGE